MAYGEFAKIYDELINEDINYNEMVDFILKVCNENNIKFNDYLDIACGTGNITVRLAKHLLDSTNYITDIEGLKKYFKGVYDHLKDDGIFIFDINSYYKLSEILGNNIYTYSEEEVFYTWENVFEEDLLSMFLTFFVKKGDLYEKIEEEHIERAYKESEIEEILQELNLNIINKFDGYLNNNVQANSERIVYIVKKK